MSSVVRIPQNAPATPMQNVLNRPKLNPLRFMVPQVNFNTYLRSMAKLRRHAMCTTAFTTTAYGLPPDPRFFARCLIVAHQPPRTPPSTGPPPSPWERSPCQTAGRRLTAGKAGGENGPAERGARRWVSIGQSTVAFRSAKAASFRGTAVRMIDAASASEKVYRNRSCQP